MAWRMGKQTRGRWGLGTLFFLVLALAGVVISNLQQYYTLLTLGLIVVGFVGAAYCTIVGWMRMKN